MMPLVCVGLAGDGHTMEAITGWDGFRYPMAESYRFGIALSEVRTKVESRLAKGYDVFDTCDRTKTECCEEILFDEGVEARNWVVSMLFSPKKGLVEIGLLLSGFLDKGKAYLELKGAFAQRYGEGKEYTVSNNETCKELVTRFYMGDKIYEFQLRRSHMITAYDIDQTGRSIRLKFDEITTCADLPSEMHDAWDLPLDPSDNSSFDLWVTYRADDSAKNACDQGIAFPQ